MTTCYILKKCIDIIFIFIINYYYYLLKYIDRCERFYKDKHCLIRLWHCIHVCHNTVDWWKASRWPERTQRVDSSVPFRQTIDSRTERQRRVSRQDSWSPRKSVSRKRRLLWRLSSLANLSNSQIWIRLFASSPEERPSILGCMSYFVRQTISCHRLKAKRGNVPVATKMRRSRRIPPRWWWWWWLWERSWGPFSSMCVWREGLDEQWPENSFVQPYIRVPLKSRRRRGRAN